MYWLSKLPDRTGERRNKVNEKPTGFPLIPTKSSHGVSLSLSMRPPVSDPTFWSLQSASRCSSSPGNRTPTQTHYRAQHHTQRSDTHVSTVTHTTQHRTMGPVIFITRDSGCTTMLGFWGILVWIHDETTFEAESYCLFKSLSLFLIPHLSHHSLHVIMTLTPMCVCFRVNSVACAYM